MAENNAGRAALLEGVDAKTPNPVRGVGKVDLAIIFPLLLENAWNLFIDELLHFRAREWIHVYGLQPTAQTDVARLVGFDNDVARAALDGELEEFVEDFYVHLNWPA
jgi:hypothetical protein